MESFLFGGSDLATAVRHGINLVTILFNNEAYGNVLRDQRRLFEGRESGSALSNPDFQLYAKAFGVCAPGGSTRRGRPARRADRGTDRKRPDVDRGNDRHHPEILAVGGHFPRQGITRGARLSGRLIHRHADERDAPIAHHP